MKIRQKSPEAFLHKGNDTGILLIHGFTGTASEMRPMGKALYSAGYTVYAPLLAGHGTNPEDMEKTTWEDWWKSAVDAYDKLVDEGCTSIYVAGLSMGGLLSLMLAAEKEVKGVIPLCAPIFVQDTRLRFTGLFKYFLKYEKRSGEKEPHIESEIVPLDRTPLVSYHNLYKLIRLAKTKIPNVSCPILVVQASKDETIQPRSADYIMEHVSSQTKDIKWYHNSSHIITVDKEREKLFRDVLEFISNLENRVTIELGAESETDGK